MTISASSELEAPAAGSQVNMRKVAFASVIGTTVEWYDLFIFATASALVFNKIFFPEFDELIGTLLALELLLLPTELVLLGRHFSATLATSWGGSQCCLSHYWLWDSLPLPSGCCRTTPPSACGRRYCY
jgi:hypothetical protein